MIWLFFRSFSRLVIICFQVIEACYRYLLAIFLSAPLLLLRIPSVLLSSSLHHPLRPSLIDYFLFIPYRPQNSILLSDVHPLFLTCGIRSDSDSTDITSYNPQYLYIILLMLAIELIFGGLHIYNSFVPGYIFSIPLCHQDVSSHFFLRFCVPLKPYLIPSR